MKRLVPAFLLGCTLLAVNSSAYALFGDDEARKAILELRQQLKAQQDVQMNLYDRLEKLTQEVQQLRGQVDVLNNSLGKERQNTQNLYGDLTNRIDEMDPKAKAAKAAEDKEILAEQELRKCTDFFNKGQADKAISCFGAAVKTYGSTKQYPTLLYWLGSSYYLKGDSAKCIENEQRLISKYPSHAQVPDAYLLVGMAQLDQKKISQAKTTLNQLITRFPKSSAAAMAKKQLADIK